MPRRLYEVTVSCQLFWLGDGPPTLALAFDAAREEACWEVESRVVHSDTIGAGELSIVFGPEEDVTLREALEEVRR